MAIRGERSFFSLQRRDDNNLGQTQIAFRILKSWTNSIVLTAAKAPISSID